MRFGGVRLRGWRSFKVYQSIYDILDHEPQQLGFDNLHLKTGDLATGW